MRAGKLRHRVTIQQADRTTHDDGSYDITWTDCTNGHVQASIQPLTSKELWQARQVDDHSTHTVRMRYFKGLTAHHRLLFGERVFQIEGPPLDVDERHVEFELRCREDVGEDA
jgi:SPP1 family predicted phage head-tail adaptor